MEAAATDGTPAAILTTATDGTTIESDPLTIIEMATGTVIIGLAAAATGITIVVVAGIATAVVAAVIGIITAETAGTAKEEARIGTVSGIPTVAAGMWTPLEVAVLPLKEQEEGCRGITIETETAGITTGADLWTEVAALPVPALMTGEEEATGIATEEGRVVPAIVGPTTD